jgi:mono/diheme cytochrome c family protein
MRGTILIAGILLTGAMTACSVAPPGKVETRLITIAKHRVLVGEAKVRNPMNTDAETIERGRRAFSSYCVACHGLDGQNSGVPFAEAMSPPVADLKSAEVQSYSDGQLHAIIRDGIRPSGMPAARGILNDEELWSIVAFLRHLPPKGSLGEPAIYGGAPSP